MPLKITYNNTEVILDLLEVSEEKNCFILGNSNTGDTGVKVEFIFTPSFQFNDIVSSYKEVNEVFEEAYLFKNQHFSQSKIIELRTTSSSDNDGKLGYFFTINSFIDIDNQILFPNKFLRTAAYRAYVSLLKGEVKCKLKVPSFSNSDLTLSDFYDETDILLILSKIFYKKVKNFNFVNQYLYPLKNFGFVITEDLSNQIFENEYEIVKNRFYELNDNDAEYHILKISPVSNLIQEINYFDVLIRKLIPTLSIHPVIKFHYLYQVIEILIDFVLKNEIKKQIVNEIDSFSSYQLQQKINDLTSVPKRINFIFNNYSDIDNNIKDDIARDLIEYVHIFNGVAKEKTELEILFYAFRNGIVHDHKEIYTSKISLPENIDKWNNIMDKIEFLIIEVISKFELK